MLPAVLLGVFVGWTVREVWKRRERERICAQWEREHEESAGACAATGTPPPMAPAATGHTSRQED